jgi:hypothetical protein
VIFSIVPLAVADVEENKGSSHAKRKLKRMRLALRKSCKAVVAIVLTADQKDTHGRRARSLVRDP